ncbi:YhgE/Pip domain-containing protein [Corynebacterium sp. MSK044]|uniref:YhgE/Pip domain-containing protein n=1 Tax=Corynebacterium sp. MSK044 TaxID=3050195 RepID=UPI002550AF62|nr:YhgE/Pip domain-containing protein [Corynebacterium sp. MSK044]MDK8798283.1 YhgE/Pip domain-containing protein [Corynebacterium sp. MSK044]
MISGLNVGTHFRKLLRGVLPPLALIAITLLPLLFGGLFVWSYWDPLGNLNKIPVALVNSDEGAQGPDGKEVRAGDQVAAELLKVEPMNFVEVSAQDAIEGIGNGTYYLGVEIPKNFSEAAVSVNTDDPHPAKINVTLNNTNGFIPTMLGNQVTRVMTSVISGTVGEQISRQMFMGFNTIGDGMDQAGEGADKLHDGTTQARDGSQRLNDGANQLNDGVQEALQKVPDLVDGATQLDEGAHELNSGAQRLNDGLGQASTGADELADGLGRLRDGVNQAAGVLAPVNIPQLQQGTPAEFLDGINSAADGARELSNALHLLHDGSGELLTGTTQLSDGTTQLVVGVRTLSEGSNVLADGTQQLAAGMDDLNSGIIQLDDGSGELAFKLNEGAGKVPRFDGEKLDSASSVASSPVRLENTGDDVSLFGVGLSPFFLSLSLWFGGLIMFMVFNPISRRAIDSGVSPLRVVLSSWIPAAILGVIQAFHLWWMQNLVLGVNAEHPVQMFFALAYVAIIFVTAILAIYAIFGPSTGRLITMILMSLQLVASNGLYPPEVQPEFIQWVHSWDPMRFSVDLMRHVLFGTAPGDHRVTVALIVLTSVGVASFLIAMAGFWKERVVVAKHIHPELEV